MKNFIPLAIVVALLLAVMVFHLGAESDFRLDTPEKFFATEIDLGEGLPTFDLPGAYSKSNVKYINPDKEGFAESYYSGKTKPIYTLYRYKKSDVALNNITDYDINAAAEYAAEKYGGGAECSFVDIRDVRYGFYDYYTSYENGGMIVESYVFDTGEEIVSVDIGFVCDDIEIKGTEKRIWIPKDYKDYKSTQKDIREGLAAGFTYDASYGLPQILIYKLKDTASAAEGIATKDYDDVTIGIRIINYDGMPEFDSKALFDGIH